MELSRRRRTGCTECRRKKAKCDEKKPVCSRCSKFPRLCSYDLNIVRTHFNAPNHSTVHQLQISPLSQNQPPPRHSRSQQPTSFSIGHQNSKLSTQHASPVSSVSDLSTYRLSAFPMLRSGRHRFHFDHFIANTARIYFPLQPNTILSFVIPVAESHGYMLGALLAASYSHYFRLEGNETSRTASIEATVETLSSLRGAITATATRSEGMAVLSTSLLLATTCLCAGDTETYRKHLDGALLIVQRDGWRYKANPLWDFSLKWLVHLLLMNRVSGLPLPPQQESSALDWGLLLSSMPTSGQVDESTGLSHNLVSILNEVCDLSDMNSPARCPSALSAHMWTQAELQGSDVLLPGPADVHSQSLETRLFQSRENTPPPTPHESNAITSTELQCSNSLFTDATLLCLYRRVHDLPKQHVKVQDTVASIIASLKKMDKHSQANIPLLWPLLSAGCEATTEYQRSFIADRMTAMGSHGLGNCLIILGFMRKYWSEGGDLRWNDFAKQVGMDLVLF